MPIQMLIHAYAQGYFSAVSLGQLDRMRTCPNGLGLQRE